MKIISSSIFLVLAVVIVLFAISNRGPVELAIWPLEDTIVLPLFVPVLVCAALALLVGIAMGWASGAPARRLSRRRGARVAELEDRIKVLEARHETAAQPTAVRTNPPALRQIPGGRG